MLLTSQNSYNNRLSLKAREFFVPKKSQIFLYALISALFLVLINSREIWHKFSTNYLGQTSFSDAVHQSYPGLTNFINELQSGRLPMIAFWALVGCSIYIIVWFTANIISNIRNDLIADSYIAPQNPGRRRMFWESVFTRKLLLALSIGSLGFYIYAGLSFARSISEYFYSSIDVFKMPSSLIKIAVSISLVSLLLYVLIVLTHLTSQLWRLVYRDF